MDRLLKVGTVLAAILTLGVLAGPAPAAKGIKKTIGHNVTGKIVAVSHPKKGIAGTLTIHVAGHKQKKGAGVVRAAGLDQSFVITHHTHVHGAAGIRAHGPGALHVGQHVTVHATQLMAHTVVIHHPNKLRVAKR
jgi:hypothetical protein